MRVPQKPVVEEVVEYFPCSNPSCPSHTSGQPAAIIRWNDGETSRRIPCGVCYHEVYGKPEKVLDEAGKLVGMKDGAQERHGVFVECQRGQGPILIKRDANTYEVIEVLKKPE